MQAVHFRLDMNRVLGILTSQKKGGGGGGGKELMWTSESFLSGVIFWKL